MPEVVTVKPAELPVGPSYGKGIGWNGLVTMIASEGALFAYLLFSYYYCGAVSPAPWVLEAHPSLRLAGPNTLILLLSSVAAWVGERGVAKGNGRKAVGGSGVALLLGIAFVVIQVFEWKAKHFGIGSSSYASLYFVTTGFHMAHVLVGLVVLFMLFVWALRGWFGPDRRLVYTCGAWYWHFVDAVWLTVFFTYYLTPYLGFGS
jgi:heme/copper-type cytochrome/quinol oxidase subunit 3